MVDPLQVQKVELEVAAELTLTASLSGQDVAVYCRGLTTVTVHCDLLLTHDSTPKNQHE